MTRATRELAIPGVLLGLLFLNGGPTEVRAKDSPVKSESVVKVDVTADKPDADGKQVLTVTLEMKPDWFIIANPAEVEPFEKERARVEVIRDGKPIEAKLDYPQGKLIKDGTDNLRIYEKKVIIKATLPRARNDTGPLKVRVRFRAFSYKVSRCLTAAVVERDVP
jgi:hypothetical protein